MSFGHIAYSTAASSARSDTLGCVTECLGESQEFFAGDLRFYRKKAPAGQISRVQTPASERGFLVGVSMQPGHRRRIFNGSHNTLHEFGTHDVYLRDFGDDYLADLSGGFDFLLFEVPRRYLNDLNDEDGGRAVHSLRCGAGMRDPVLGHLAQVVAPLLMRPVDVGGLFLEQLGLAIGTRLLEGYACRRSQAVGENVVLSDRQLALATEMLMPGDGASEVSIAAIAQACALSRSHFIRAFTKVTGQSPYQWHLQQRISKARTLLRFSDMPLVDIALACHFADQSHFTRVFLRITGIPPGRWRRTTRH